MNKYIKVLALFFASLFLITTVPLQAWGAGENSFLAATAGSTQTEAAEAEAAEASESDSSTEAAASDGSAAFSYEHDPMENPKAAEDIMVDPDAVYGYSPRPDSVRLKAYADADWSDAALVESARQDRLAYHESFSELYRMIEQMLGEAKDVEEIARAVSTCRNEIRLESYKDNPQGLEKVKKSNLDTYGNENGPTPEFLYEKYGSWQTVLEKSLSSNPGMDACLGLYDMYYDTYEIEERVLEAADAETAAEGNPAGATDNAEAAGTNAGEAAEPDAGEADGTASGESADHTEETASGTEAKTYKVLSGDSLWKIAQDQYGDGSKWNMIYEANKDEIHDPGLIYPGQELKIPNAA